MRINTVTVRNFRCLRDITVDCNELTALIGSNGAGKSSILKAIEMFYTPNASYSEEDFYDRNNSDEISVQIEFTDLSEQATERFDSYIGGSTLTVEKVMEFPDNQSNQRYYGNRLYNPDFDDFRSAGGHDLRREYEQLREGEYSGLPEYQNQTEAERELREWEDSNPEDCERRRDEGQFFGFNPVGEAALEEFTQYILIPAVRDAGEDAEDRRNSPLTELMDVVVRATLNDREELEEFQAAARIGYERIVEEAGEDGLSELEHDLSTTLETFAPGVGVNLDWDTDGVIDIQMPKAKIRLEVDDFESSVEHAGHGSQRAFIISLLQNLAIRSGDQSEEDGIPEPSLILGIEEPELYQHPNRQRHLMSILSSFEDQEIAGAASSVQAVYSTHSPLMVNMKRFDDIRSLSKNPSEDGGPRATTVRKSSMDDVARGFEDAANVERGSFSDQSTRARLEPIMTPWINEGFFSETVVLVEGLEDRSAILGRAEARDLDLGSGGIAILPCNGKTKLGGPAIVFEELGKSVYVVFDSDYDDEDEIETNRQLLRLVGSDLEDDWPSGIYENFACFQTNLTNVLRNTLGEEYYEDLLSDICEQFGYNKLTKGRKNPTVMSELFRQAERDGKDINHIDNIIDEAMRL